MTTSPETERKNRFHSKTKLNKKIWDKYLDAKSRESQICSSKGSDSVVYWSNVFFRMECSHIRIIHRFYINVKATGCSYACDWQMSLLRFFVDYNYSWLISKDIISNHKQKPANIIFEINLIETFQCEYSSN